MVVILGLEPTTSRMQVQNAGYHKIKKLNFCPTLFSKVDPSITYPIILKTDQSTSCSLEQNADHEIMNI